MTYYETLGIDADATEDDIRKAYRKQALLWHPDKNVQRKEEAEEKFKLISEAYEVLSDTEKRRIYDLYGEEGLKNNGPSYDNYDHGSRPHFPFQFHDPRDIFNTFFGGRDPFAEMLGQQFFGTGFASPFMPGFGMTSAGAGPRSRSFDPFFSDFGNFGGSGTSSSSSFSFSSNSFSGGGRGGFVKKSTRTQIVNGVRTTVTTTEDAQGNVTVVTETNGTREVLVNNRPQALNDVPQNLIDEGRRRNIPIQGEREQRREQQQRSSLFQQQQQQQQQRATPYQQQQQFQQPPYQQQQQYQQPQQQYQQHYQQQQYQQYQDPQYQQQQYQQYQQYQDQDPQQHFSNNNSQGGKPWIPRKS